MRAITIAGLINAPFEFVFSMVADTRNLSKAIP